MKMKKNKKVDIITFQCAHNYGAILQVYALQQTIEKMHKKVEIINYKNKIIERQYKVINVDRKNLKNFLKSIVSDILFFQKRYKRYQNFEKFVKERLNLTKIYKSEEALKNEPPIADVYITGSDQVWNSNITYGLQDAYTLNFGKKNIKRISYAASIGNSKISDNEKEIYKEKISIINNISVREESGKKALEQIIYSPIEVVLDPTLLLTKKQWENEIKTLTGNKEKYILAYVVEKDEQYIKIVNDLSEKTGLKIIHFGKTNPGYKNVLKSAYTEGPLEFINYIKNAEYVVATSFHATVFSVIFHKKFFIIPHKKTGSRVTNLLDKLGIENRTFNTLEEFKNIDYNFGTNWDNVEERLGKERKKSLDWLEKSINEGKDSNE